jgi:hypothetical protein
MGFLFIDASGTQIVASSTGNSPSTMNNENKKQKERT